MQGLFIDGSRPKSKKAVREAIADNPARVSLEATSIFGNEYDGPASDMPLGQIYFVGPDPSRKRNFYGQLHRTADGWKVK